MSSRASYLSKYLDKPKEELKKKKKKKNKHSEQAVSVVIEKPGIIDEEPNDDVAEDIEETPIEVDIPTSKKFMGFRRIDNKEMTDRVVPSPASTPEFEQKTIYRDLTGKRIDIEEKRKQLARKKEEEEKRKQEEHRINLGEANVLEQEANEKKVKSAATFSVSRNDREYNDQLKREKRMEDPIITFQHESETTNNTTSTGRYTYNKGINPRNRFNIKAGYFWDGVDRSNGFETQIVRKREQQNISKLKTSVDESYDFDLD